MNILRCKKCNREIPDPKRKKQKYCNSSERNCVFDINQELLKEKKRLKKDLPNKTREEIKSNLAKLRSIVSEISYKRTKTTSMVKHSSVIQGKPIGTGLKETDQSTNGGVKNNLK